MNLWERIKFWFFKFWFKQPKPEKPVTVDTLIQALNIMSSDSKVNKLYTDFCAEASKPDPDQAKLDLMILQAKDLDATFDYTVEPDGAIEITMSCNVQLSNGSLYFDKKQKM